MGGADDNEIAAIEREVAAEFEEAVAFSTGSAEVSLDEFREFARDY